MGVSAFQQLIESVVFVIHGKITFVNIIFSTISL
jgi:hypothetical protein